jgi:hypothetical protein
MLVDQSAHITDVLFKHSIGRWVCDHDGSQVLLVFINLCEEEKTKGVNISFLAKPCLFILKD